MGPTKRLRLLRFSRIKSEDITPESLEETGLLIRNLESVTIFFHAHSGNSQANLVISTASWNVTIELKTYQLRGRSLLR